MTHKKIALINAVLFFCFWLIILYAGADHPPPPGFIQVIFLDLGCAFVVYLRVPTYIHWIIERKKHRLFYILRDGVMAGFCAGFIVVVASALRAFLGGESDFSSSVISIMIWFAVLGGVGVVNAVMIYSINAVVVSRIRMTD